MEIKSAVNRLLESPRVYSLWQAPFARAKLAPVLTSPGFASAGSVLDVGCGPGTNARTFSEVDYVGVDLNHRYISWASQRHEGTFFVADVTRGLPDGLSTFDLVLVNSLLHHLSDEDADRLLRSLRRYMDNDSTVEILDLVLPEDPRPSRWLALMDRGEWPRPFEVWRNLFRDCFEEEECRVYPLSAFGVELWRMVYFRGRLRNE